MTSLGLNNSRIELRIVNKNDQFSPINRSIQNQRKERKTQKQLFDDDFVEQTIRRRRSDDISDDYYYDYENYPEYILTEGRKRIKIPKSRDFRYYAR